MSGGGRVKYSVPAPPLSKHRRSSAGICRQAYIAPDNHGMSRRTTRLAALSPWKTRRVSTSHVSASRPDLHGNLRLPGESWRQRHQGHRLAVQVGPRRGHDTWGTNSFNDGFPLARDHGFQRLIFLPATPRARRLGGSPLRPLARLRSPPPEPMRAPASSPNAASSDEVRQQPGKARPLPSPGSPAWRVDFSRRVQLASNKW